MAAVIADLGTQDLVRLLLAFRRGIRPRRFFKLQTAAMQRRFDVIPVLENVVNPRNAAAVMRVADAYGVAQIRVISSLDVLGITAPDSADDGNDTSGPDMGASRWLDVRVHHSSKACIDELHRSEFQCLGAEFFDSQSLESVLDAVVDPGISHSTDYGHETSAKEAHPSATAGLAVRGREMAAGAAHATSRSRRIALVMGNEHRGVSKRLSGLCDHQFHLPQAGLVQSLNLAVATGIALHETCNTVSRSGFARCGGKGMDVWRSTCAETLEHAASCIMARRLPESLVGQPLSKPIDDMAVAAIAGHIEQYDALHGAFNLDLPELWPDAEGIASIWGGQSSREKQAHHAKLAAHAGTEDPAVHPGLDDPSLHPLQRRWRTLSRPGSALAKLSVAAHNHDLFVMDSRRLRLLVTWLLRILSGNVRALNSQRQSPDPRVMEILERI
jgi:tRNA G18 (ribose-2'-O)-methylase SpoU